MRLHKDMHCREQGDFASTEKRDWGGDTRYDGGACMQPATRVSDSNSSVSLHIKVGIL